MDSKTKAAFTRKYNKEAVLLPYSVTQAVKKKAKEAVDVMPGEVTDFDIKYFDKFLVSWLVRLSETVLTLLGTSRSQC